MGKRKHLDEEEYLARKMRKLEKKMSRVRRKRRYRSSSSSLERDHCSDSDNNYPASWQEAPQHEGSPDEVITDSIPMTTAIPSIPSAITTTPAAPLGPATELASVVIPASTPAAEPPVEHAPAESNQELEPDILSLLGDEPVLEEKFGENIHKDIASRWSDILVNGLKDETKTDLLRRYSIPENLKLSQAPALNPEIKAAVNESALKRDNILIDKQKVLSTVISCVANTVTSVLNTGLDDDIFKCNTLKSLSDAGRLLCHIHYNETQTRRNFLLACLNKEIKDNVKDLKRDNLLFGSVLQDSIKSMKAIIKTGTELKPTPAKPKAPLKNIQPKETTSRALNWRGPPPPQMQPRRAPARQASTAGGRKLQPTRRGTDRRPQRQQHRHSRR